MDWQALEHEITQALVDLTDNSFLVLMTGPPAPRRRFRRPDPAQEPDYVQARLLTGLLTAECSASGAVEGLTVLGWRAPEAAPEWLPARVRSAWREWPVPGAVPPGVAEAAARLAVATLRGPLRVSDPAQVIVQRGA